MNCPRLPCDITFLLNDFPPFSVIGFHDMRGVQSGEVLCSSRALALNMGEGIRYANILQC